MDSSQPLASNVIYTSQTNGKMMNSAQSRSAFISDQTNHRQYNPIRVMTYNVHYWRDPTDTKVNFNEMIALIHKLDPDILILEEVSFSVVSKEQVHAAFKDYHISFCEAAKLYGGPFGNLIASKFPIKASKVLKLMEFHEGRCAVVADIELFPGKIIRVYGFHLDAFDSTEQVRLNQIQQIVTDATSSPYPTLLAGDYNSVRRKDYTNDEWTILSYQWKTSLRTDVTDFLEKNGFKTSFDKAKLTNPKYTGTRGLTIDFLYLGSNWTFPVKTSFVYHDASSDHIPVLLDFSL